MKPKSNQTADGELACAFHEKWLGPHPLCRAETARVCGVSIDEVPDPDLSRFAERSNDKIPEPISAVRDGWLF